MKLTTQFAIREVRERVNPGYPALGLAAAVAALAGLGRFARLGPFGRFDTVPGTWRATATVSQPPRSVVNGQASMLGLAQTALPNRRLEVAIALRRLRSDEVRTRSCAVMPMLTTTIGAYPKPAYVRLPDWFAQPGGTPIADPTRDWAGAMAAMGRDPEPILARGVRSAVGDQVEAGIDIPTDGEIVRENYIHYHCRHLNGVTFDRLEEKALRNDAYRAHLPTIVGPIKAGAPFLPFDYRRAQSCTDRAVKLTMPGPMTIADTTVDLFYGDTCALGRDVADALNREVLALAAAGCRHIQIDEPLFARESDEALSYGIEHLERAFHGCPEHVTRTVHMCCGYPDRLDSDDYPKADPGSYFRLASTLDEAEIDAVSIEDAHRPNDLSLLEAFSRSTVILGVVAIAKSRVEPTREIRERLRDALAHIDPHRLIAAPDCGLGLLGRDLARRKLTNLCRAAGAVGGG